jgi:hypothetical protein
LARRVNFRRTLLAAVDAFLEDAPGSIEKGLRLVERCYAARQFTTLDEVVWGGIISELTDSVFYEHLPTLRKYRVMLAYGSREIHRAYLNFDFRDQFDQVEQVWYAELWDMLDFFQGFPFDDAELARADHERRKLRITHYALHSPPPARLGDEMIYHFIMREVAEITTNLALSPAFIVPARMIPSGTYSSFPPQPRIPRHQLDDEPDLGESLVWARKALRSIVEEGWMLITWQVTRHHYNLSLH